MPTTRLNFYNNIGRPNSDSILLFLQPVDPKDNYQFYAWNVLNPSYQTNQFADLTTEFSGSIASFGDSRGSYTRPVGLSLGRALTVENPNNQSPRIGDSGKTLAAQQVGIENLTESPPTPLSVSWYVNNNKVVETNNTPVTTLQPGFTSTFELKQSIYCMLAQAPTTTTTYTLQTFSATTEFKIPLNVSQLYFEAYVDSKGVASFREMEKPKFLELQERAMQRVAALRK